MPQYRIDWDYGQGGSETIEADSLSDALDECRTIAHDADWNILATGAGTIVKCRAILLDDDGERTDDFVDGLEVIDPDEPECPGDDGGHEWVTGIYSDSCQYCNLIRRSVQDDQYQDYDVLEYDTDRQVGPVTKE